MQGMRAGLMAAEAVRYVRIGGIDVERVGVEVLAEPGALVRVFGMRGVGDGGEKFGVAPRAAAVLRRAVAPSCDAGGIPACVEGWLRLLDQHLMFPVVAEVVRVGEAGDPGF